MIRKEVKQGEISTFFYLVSLVELKAAMESLGEKLSSEEVERMMQQADSDGDGLVSFDEFAIMMNK